MSRISARCAPIVGRLHRASLRALSRRSVGGQIIHRSLENHYGEIGRQGAGFYVFDGIPKIKPFRDHYRELLDQAAISVADRERLVAEAVVAFELNRAVFVDLAVDSSPPSEGR